MSKDKDDKKEAPVTKEERMAAMGTKYWYLVYVGVRADAKGAKAYWYLPISDEEAKTKNVEPAKMPGRYFSNCNTWGAKKLANVRPGSIIRVEGAADQEGPNRIYIKSGEYFGRISDEDTATRWQAEADAIEREIAAAKKKEEDRARNLVFERLEPLRSAYRAASPGARVQMLADFIRYITG